MGQEVFDRRAKLDKAALAFIIKMEKEPKVYIIKFLNKRFNNKNFGSYEAARKYVRKLITARVGKYNDSIGTFGFSIVAK
jgi:hypothetical protein